MNSPETFDALYYGQPVKLTVHEYLPYEPANYVTIPGWVCTDSLGTEFFVDEAGILWQQPENQEVGNVPSLVTASDRLEAEIDKSMLCFACGGNVEDCDCAGEGSDCQGGTHGN